MTETEERPTARVEEAGRRPRVLVTDGGYKHTLGIVRDLAPIATVLVAGQRRLSMAGVSRFAARNLRCPPVTDGPAFVAWLDRVVRRERIDQIVPVGALSCALLSEHRDRWLPGTTVVLPPPETVRAALDKRAVLALGAEVGVPVPRTAEPSSPDEVEACAAQVGYPLVIKGPVEGSSDIGYVDDPNDLADAYRAYLERNRWAGAPYPILQQRIVGPGFGVFATYQEGRCRRIMAHRRIREYPSSGGASSCAETVDDPVLYDLGRRVLDALRWHGVAMVEFKRNDADGLYYLMEVNPKFWGSLDLALAAGADFPADLLRIGRGEQLPEFAPPAAGLRLCWPVSGDVHHLAGRPAALPSVLRDWLSPSVRTNVRLSDPLPHVVELAETAGSFVPRPSRVARRLSRLARRSGE